jgi:hypothetical protein
MWIGTCMHARLKVRKWKDPDRGAVSLLEAVLLVLLLQLERVAVGRIAWRTDKDRLIVVMVTMASNGNGRISGH